MLNLSPASYRNVEDERVVNSKKVYSRRPWYAPPVDPDEILREQEAYTGESRDVDTGDTAVSKKQARVIGATSCAKLVICTISLKLENCALNLSAVRRNKEVPSKKLKVGWISFSRKYLKLCMAVPLESQFHILISFYTVFNLNTP